MYQREIAQAGPLRRDDFVVFLLNAKRNTYAVQGDDASAEPALPGSRQLEYRAGQFAYRDVYFGMGYFVGQEVVYYDGQPVWSMCYAGGMDPAISSPDEIGRCYWFLQAALRQVSPELPYRGPRTFGDGEYRYENEVCGDLDRFRGREVITVAGREVYELQYFGGFLR